MKEKMGGVMKPMTRDEALKILAIEQDIEDEVDPKHVMERFDLLFEKN